MHFGVMQNVNMLTTKRKMALSCSMPFKTWTSSSDLQTTIRDRWLQVASASCKGWPEKGSSHSANTGTSQEWLGHGCVVGFVVKFLPKSGSSSWTVKVAAGRRQGGENIYHAICPLAFLAEASSAVWAKSATGGWRRERNANDTIIILLKLHSATILCRTPADLSKWQARRAAERKPSLFPHFLVIIGSGWVPPWRKSYPCIENDKLEIYGLLTES